MKQELEQFQEAIEIQSCLFQDMAQGGTFDGAMSWHGKLENFFAEAFLQSQVAAALAD